MSRYIRTFFSYTQNSSSHYHAWISMIFFPAFWLLVACDRAERERFGSVKKSTKNFNTKRRMRQYMEEAPCVESLWVQFLSPFLNDPRSLQNFSPAPFYCAHPTHQLSWRKISFLMSLADAQWMDKMNPAHDRKILRLATIKFNAWQICVVGARVNKKDYHDRIYCNDRFLVLFFFHPPR